LNVAQIVLWDAIRELVSVFNDQWSGNSWTASGLSLKTQNQTPLAVRFAMNPIESFVWS